MLQYSHIVRPPSYEAGATIPPPGSQIRTTPVRAPAGIAVCAAAISIIAPSAVRRYRKGGVPKADILRLLQFLQAFFLIAGKSVLRRSSSGVFNGTR
jgi:hypothetical protein